MIDELETVWKEAVWPNQGKVLYQHLSGWMEENHEKPQSGQSGSQLRFEVIPLKYKCGASFLHQVPAVYCKWLLWRL
jgi:hypothetical protein